MTAEAMSNQSGGFSMARPVPRKNVALIVRVVDMDEPLWTARAPNLVQRRPCHFSSRCVMSDDRKSQSGNPCRFHWLMQHHLS
jgi:hypothetical protein